METVRRAMLVALIALVAGVAGAIGAATFHWYVIQPSDGELKSSISESVPTGFVVDWGPGMWGSSFERGYPRMGVSSDDKVSIETVAADLQERGWTTYVDKDERAFSSLTAYKDHLWLDVTVWYNRASITGPVDEDEHGTRVELALVRGAQTPSEGAIVTLGFTLAIAASVTLTLRLTRRRT